MDGKLDGWKEIANHLCKSVKTAQRWEQQHGMPVHRIAGNDSTSTSVFAFRGELDAWIRCQERPADNDRGRADENRRSEHEPPGGPQRRATPSSEGHAQLLRRRRLVTVTAMLLLAVFTALLLAWDWRAQPANPMRATLVDGRRFAVQDSDGAVLWEREFDEPFKAQLRASTYPEMVPPWAFHDLDDDGVHEVLLVRSRPDRLGVSLGLTCFDASGNESWTVEVGREIRLDGEDYRNQFQIGPLAFGRGNDGKPIIVVAANHRPYSPSQVLVLDPDGNTLGEYVNDGYTLALRTHDFDGDGTDEVFLGGVNDALHRPFFALIEHDIPPTLSPGPAADLKKLTRGNEIAYITLPRTRAAEALSLDAWVSGFRTHGDQIIVDVYTSGGRYTHTERVYLFDRHLRPERLTLPAAFRSLHQSLLHDGTISRTLEEEAARLRQVEHLVPDDSQPVRGLGP